LRNRSIIKTDIEYEDTDVIFMGARSFKKHLSIFFSFLFLSISVGSRSFAYCTVEIESLIPLVVAKLPHDREAFTQGLAIEDDQLYESTGLYQHSSLRHLDLFTGQVVQKHSLSSEIFAEGLAAFPHVLLQITWREQRAFVYDRSSLKLLKILSYSGEGWGLCRDGETVWMSNGTSTLIQRDLQTFSVLKKLPVYLKGEPIAFLNDLECDGNHLYANVWKKDWLIRIDKTTGEVTGIIDASHLLSIRDKALLGLDGVLNGIAFRPKTGTFFVTGKGWPWIFEVRFISQKKKL
jgi:glutaminyl-peptide cyclotransferase